MKRRTNRILLVFLAVGFFTACAFAADSKGPTLSQRCPQVKHDQASLSLEALRSRRSENSMGGLHTRGQQQDVCDSWQLALDTIELTQRDIAKAELALKQKEQAVSKIQGFAARDRAIQDLRAERARVNQQLQTQRDLIEHSKSNIAALERNPNKKTF